MNILASKLFSWRQILLYAAVFVGTIIVLQRTLRKVCSDLVAFDCPYYWPVSVFQFRMPTLRDIAVAAAVTLLFYIAFRILESLKYSLPAVFLTGVLLISGLTFIHGIEVGFYTPISGNAVSGELIANSTEGQEYYHDALKIADPVDFMRRYNEIQPTLSMHGHTHPPGATLVFWVLEKLLGDPALMSIAIMLISCSLTMYFVYRLIATEFKDETAKYMSFLVLILPVVQIYYLASLDALITALLTGIIYLFAFGKGHRSAVGASLMLSLSFLLTFVNLFILPVIVCYDVLVNKSLRRSTIVIGVVVVFHLVLYFAFGYNAYQSFRTASLYENPHGFMGYVDPVNYGFTRLEDVAELVFFFGPFLLILMYRGLKKIEFKPLNVLTGLAVLTLLAMFVTGAWRTGETARACAFIYPYLLFPVARYLENSEAGMPERGQLAALVFLQAIGMQLFGNFHW